jgi:hypothetical protein
MLSVGEVLINLLGYESAGVMLTGNYQTIRTPQGDFFMPQSPNLADIVGGEVNSFVNLSGPHVYNSIHPPARYLPYTDGQFQ